MMHGAPPSADSRWGLRPQDSVGIALAVRAALHRETRALERRAVRYPLAGAMLAAGSPLGHLVLRLLLGHVEPTPAAIVAELEGEAATYLYMALATLAVFLLLGRLLGRREDTLAERSATDALTGLWNRRHLVLRTDEEIARAARHDTALALLMIDVDGLKPINDRWGHEAGDAALELVAGALREATRTSDVPARVGGDEFAVLAPATTAREALELAERIRSVLRERTPRTSRRPPLSVSIGVADLGDADPRSTAGLYEAADAALYRAKALGRDRAALAPRHAERSHSQPTIPRDLLH